MRLIAINRLTALFELSIHQIFTKIVSSTTVLKIDNKSKVS